MGKRINVLIVDDSRIFRNAVAKSLEGYDDIVVTGSVRNGIKAIEFIRETPPDIVTLDVEMPEMDGLQTLTAIQEYNRNNPSQNPVGVIMLSSLTRKGADITIKALEAGAFDFIAKPDGKEPDRNMEALKSRLATRIRSYSSKPRAAETKTGPPEFPETVSAKPSQRESCVRSKIKAIFIGVSTGGPKALMNMLPELCRKTALPILIVQHMPPEFTLSLAESLDRKTPHTVKEAEHNEVITNRHVYIAPGGFHMLAEKSGASNHIAINSQPPEKGCRPSVDVLFRSATNAYGGNVVAIILTGMGSDGTRGIRALKRSGAYVIAQDEQSSVVWGMPGSAVDSGNVDEILPLDRIPEAVGNICFERNA